MKADTKGRILYEGAKIVHLMGYHKTGIQEILRAADIPKGSFYFYFKSKEDFGLQLISYYIEKILARGETFLEQKEFSPIQRLRNHFNWLIYQSERQEFKGGCPIGNLSQELGDINEVFREKLDEAFSKLKHLISRFIKEAQAEGEISAELGVMETADLVFSCFQGALIQMKVAKNAHSLDIFDRMLTRII
ncbi:MAG: TetR family transcriptional regulator [Proteobacteria bacterium]|nr:TetR family transcriptional regulator [Pseudomonadota bacterium]